MSLAAADDLPYKISPIEGKGLGLLATRHLSPGTSILSERSTMHINVPGYLLTESDVEKAFNALGPAEKATVLSLHEGDARSSSTLLRIFKANTFGSSTACWLHPTISRINHSCIANATIDRSSDGEALVVAERHISPGEEICFTYNHELYEITTAHQRAVLLQRQYGFTCKCAACWGNSEFRRHSDARRIMIKSLKERLHGLRTSDFSLLERLDPESAEVAEMRESDFWIKEASVLDDLEVPAAEKAAKNVLLGKLREAEGLPALLSAQCYLHASEAMYEQVVGTKDVVVLEWASMCRKLMERAVELVDEARSPFDDDAQMLRATWKQMGQKPCMKVALGYLDGNIDVPIARRNAEVETPYAILIDGKQGLKVVSKPEFIALLSNRKARSTLQSSTPKVGCEPVDTSWQSKLLLQFKSTNSGYKILGAVLTCAAPIAAYWLLR